MDKIIFSLSLLPPGEIVCKSFPSPYRLQTNVGLWRIFFCLSSSSSFLWKLNIFIYSTDRLHQYPSMRRNQKVCFPPKPTTPMSRFNGRSTCCLMHVIHILHFCWIFFPGEYSFVLAHVTRHSEPLVHQNRGSPSLVFRAEVPFHLKLW